MLDGVLFVLGSRGQARFIRKRTGVHQMTITCLTDNWTRTYDSHNDSDRLQAVADVATHAQSVVGAPSIVADLSAFFGAE